MAVFGRLPMAQEIHLAQCGKCSRMVRLIDAAQHAGEQDERAVDQPPIVLGDCRGPIVDVAREELASSSAKQPSSISAGSTTSSKSLSIQHDMCTAIDLIPLQTSRNPSPGQARLRRKTRLSWTKKRSPSRRGQQVRLSC